MTWSDGVVRSEDREAALMRNQSAVVAAVEEYRLRNLQAARLTNEWLRSLVAEEERKMDAARKAWSAVAGAR